MTKPWAKVKWPKRSLSAAIRQDVTTVFTMDDERYFRRNTPHVTGGMMVGSIYRMPNRRKSTTWELVTCPLQVAALNEYLKTLQDVTPVFTMDEDER